MDETENIIIEPIPEPIIVEPTPKPSTFTVQELAELMNIPVTEITKDPFIVEPVPEPEVVIEPDIVIEPDVIDPVIDPPVDKLKAYLVFRQDDKGEYAQYSSECWKGEAPVPGTNVPESSLVLPLPDDVHVDDVRNYKLESAKATELTYSPELPPSPSGTSWVDGVYQPTDLELVESSIDDKLKAYAVDKSITDEDYALIKLKLERAKDMAVLEDKQAKVAEADAIASKNATVDNQVVE